jgi:hypothetical protein
VKSKEMEDAFVVAIVDGDLLDEVYEPVRNWLIDFGLTFM